MIKYSSVWWWTGAGSNRSASGIKLVRCFLIPPKEKKSNKYSFDASNEFFAWIRNALEAQCMVAREVENVSFVLSTAEFHVKSK